RHDRHRDLRARRRAHGRRAHGRRAARLPLRPPARGADCRQRRSGGPRRGDPRRVRRAKRRPRDRTHYARRTPHLRRGHRRAVSRRVRRRSGARHTDRGVRSRSVTDRLDVRKTYKLFVGGAFPRSESGRTMPALDADGGTLAQVPLASRKDLRDAVAAARGAQESWAARTAYNRAQILYRIAEMLEGRRAQFVDELARSAQRTPLDPDAEVSASIDRWVWYAGWADKIPQIAGGGNPVAGPYFNISVPEPAGVVVVVAPDEPPLLGLVSRLAPAIVSGNAAVVLASQAAPL